MDYRYAYGFDTIKPFIIKKLTVKERLKRAINQKSIKVFFVKEIEIPIFQMSTFIC